MERPLVSVVVPVKDGERFLAQALDSVFAQDYRPLEVLVVDGASTDRSADIARSMGARVLPQPGSGIGDAWNAGIAATEGPILAFLSHDDRWLPGKLPRQVDRLLEAPDLLFTVARFRYFLEPGCDLPRGFRPGLIAGDRVGRIMETLVARREAFDRVGGFDPTLRFGEDVDWFARAADLGLPVDAVPEVLLEKRVHDANTSADAGRCGPLLLRVLRRSVERKRRR